MRRRGVFVRTSVQRKELQNELARARDEHDNNEKFLEDLEEEDEREQEEERLVETEGAKPACNVRILHRAYCIHRPSQQLRKQA